MSEQLLVSWQNRTDLGKCTHQYDETQGNNDTWALSTKTLFFRYKKIDNKKKKKAAKKNTDEQ